MGHSVLYCDFCDTPVMEGHNDWECDCGAICNHNSGYKWVGNCSTKSVENCRKYVNIENNKLRYKQ